MKKFLFAEPSKKRPVTVKDKEKEPTKEVKKSKKEDSKEDK